MEVGGGEGEEGRKSERTKRNTKRKRNKDAMVKEEIDGRTTKKILPSDILLSSSSGSRSSSLSCIDACSSDDVLESAPRRKRNWAKVLETILKKKKDKDTQIKIKMEENNYKKTYYEKWMKA